MSALGPIEPAQPAHRVVRVKQRPRKEDREERPAYEPADEQEPAEDDGLPHVDVKA